MNDERSEYEKARDEARRQHDAELEAIGLSTEAIEEAWRLDGRRTFIAKWNEAIQAKNREQDDKRERGEQLIRQMFKNLAGQPAKLAELYRWIVSPKPPTNEIQYELAVNKVGGDMWAEVIDALESNPRPRVYKQGKVVNYDGPKKDRSDDPYWMPTPANIVTAVREGRLKALDSTVATIIWQHNRRVYRAVKDKTKRIKREEIATQLNVNFKTVSRSISRMVKAGELEVVSSGVGRQDGAIYRFPSRSSSADNSEHANGTPPNSSHTPEDNSPFANGTESR